MLTVKIVKETRSIVITVPDSWEVKQLIEDRKGKILAFWEILLDDITDDYDNLAALLAPEKRKYPLAYTMVYKLDLGEKYLYYCKWAAKLFFFIETIGKENVEADITVRI